MLLKSLEILNMRKVRQAVIEFHGAEVQVIQGANMSGKTIIGQSIALTMNGSKEFTLGMITHGEEKAEVIAYTDDGLEIRTVASDKVEQTVKQYV
jgi:predicted ATP-binding protein involved in virulence